MERQADLDLNDHLNTGDYCFLLHLRQMGNSSLRVRAMDWHAERFREPNSPRPTSVNPGRDRATHSAQASEHIQQEPLLLMGG